MHTKNGRAPRPNVRLDPHEQPLRGEPESEPETTLWDWIQREHLSTLWIVGVCLAGMTFLALQAVLSIWRAVFAWWRW